jgi:hypothetical protein
MIGCEIEHDAATERDRKPGKEPSGANLGGGPGAEASRYGEAEAGPNAVPAPLRTANRPRSYTGARANAHACLRRP